MLTVQHCAKSLTVRKFRCFSFERFVYRRDRDNAGSAYGAGCAFAQGDKFWGLQKMPKVGLKEKKKENMETNNF